MCLHELCRLCGAQDEHNRNVLDLELTQTLDRSNAIIIKAVDIIERELNISVNKDDKLPKYICNECVNQLLTMSSFKQKVQIAQVTFQDMINTKKESFIQIKDKNNTQDTKSSKENNFVSKEVNTSNIRPKIVKCDIKLDPNKQTMMKCSEQRISEDRKNCSLLLNKTVKRKNDQEGKEISRSEHRKVDVTDKKTCKTCGKSFGASSSLRYHIQAQHQDHKLTCTHPNCNKTFTMKALLTRHLKLHKEDRPFHCPTCEKTFKSLSNLRQHEGSHSDKKMYSCEICDSKFQHESSVKTHMQIHSGEKKFSCTICEKKFFQSGNLKEHIRTHTAKKLFNCDICNKSFTTSAQFKRHAKTHISTKIKEKSIPEFLDQKDMNRNVHEANQRNNNRKKSIISFAYDVSEMKADKNKSMSVVSEDIEKGVNVEAVAGVAVWDIVDKAVHSVEHNLVPDKDDNQVIFITYENKETNISNKQHTNESNTSQSQDVESSDTFRQYLDHLQSLPQNQSNLQHSSSNQ